ncbi:T9SS type A sorting domain-containing protein [Weeksella virosa]|uniref:T9SS type A sorting domain-containing protein n=1 Tax=Weeksella virosa TaxID=1014 RepID=UPI0011C03257|nr:T9SS type A sorting domain-containing protein [Weeksella virosa]
MKKIYTLLLCSFLGFSLAQNAIRLKKDYPDFTINQSLLSIENKESCGFEIPSNNFQDAFGSVSSTMIFADDFVVQSHSKLTVKNVSFNLILKQENTIHSIDLYFYTNNDGQPGELIKKFAEVPVFSSEIVGQYENNEVRKVSLEIPEDFVLEGKDKDEVYWFGIFANADTDVIYWESSYVSNSQYSAGMLMDDVFWISQAELWGLDYVEYVFSITGDCEFLSTTDLEKVDLAISPNPTSDFLTIQSKNIIDRIEIYNNLGQKVLSRELKNSSKKIDVNSLSKGNYIIQITNEGESLFRRFIKN